MARQVIQDIRLNTLSPHLFLLHVTWQTGIAVCPDVALIWRGMTPTNPDTDWTPEEDEIMRALYPRTLQVELMRALPQRAWNQILGRAHLLGLHRRAASQGIPRPLNVYHHTVRYDDLEAAASLTDDPVHQEFLHEQVDALARQTTRGTLSAYWLLALDSVGYAGNAEFKGTPAQASVGALPYGSSR
jgi:hypothetical protein